VDFYFGGYVAEDFYRYGIFAESFDGFLELELALVDFEILRGEGVGDIAGGYGAEELVVLAGFAGEVQRDTIDDAIEQAKVDKAIRELEEKFGFQNLYNLKGGILAYIDEVQPELTKY